MCHIHPPLPHTNTLSALYHVDHILLAVCCAAAPQQQQPGRLDFLDSVELFVGHGAKANDKVRGRLQASLYFMSSLYFSSRSLKT